MSNNKIALIIRNIPEVLTGIFCLLIVFIVFFELFNRAVFGVSIFGKTGEMSTICMLWVSMLGAAIGVKRGSHFVFPLIADKMGPKYGSYISISSYILIFIFSLLLIVIGYEMAILGLDEVFPALNISVFWQNIAVPFSGIIMAFYALGGVKYEFKSIKSGIKERRGYIDSLVSEVEKEIEKENT